MAVPDVEERIRMAAFAHLDRLVSSSPDGALRSADINTFQFQGRAIRLLVQSGIWKPAKLAAALTIRTTYTRPDEQPPYADDVGSDGWSSPGLTDIHQEALVARKDVHHGSKRAQ